MRVLSIETSCDDTGITIMEVRGGLKKPSFKILSDNLAIQSIHAQYGGVFPMMAKKEHIKNLPILLEKTLKETKLDKSKKPVDVIAVTYGPGLPPCLWTGITFAQELGKKWGVPVMPTNHMEGHILSVFGKNKGKFIIPKIKYPVLSLLVSGGHTELVLTKSFLKYEVIGKTQDDAAGEAFDKVGRMLGLPYPGGPKISKLAEQERMRAGLLLRGLGSATARARGIFQQKNIRAPQEQNPSKKPLRLEFSFPRPMMYTKNFDFSFSGLKTAVLYLIRKIGSLDDEKRSKIALEFENAVVETLIYKTKKAMEKYNAKTVILAGGVAANTHLRNEMKKVFGHAKGRASKKIKLLFPTRELTRDNALMIGIAGYLQYMKKKGRVGKASSIKANGSLKLS